jgi:hypothetical protein
MIVRIVNGGVGPRCRRVGSPGSSLSRPELGEVDRAGQVVHRRADRLKPATACDDEPVLARCVVPDAP